MVIIIELCFEFVIINVKDFNLTPVLDKIHDYRRNWIRYVNRMPLNRLPRIIKNYRPKANGNRGDH
jgi:hypothetical protein